MACLGTGTTSPSRRTCRFRLPGKVPRFPAILVHFPPWHEASGEVQQGMLWEVPSIQAFLKRAYAGPGVKWRFCGEKLSVQHIAKMYEPNNQRNTFKQCVGHCKSTKVCFFAKRHSPPLPAVLLALQPFLAALAVHDRITARCCLSVRRKGQP